VDDERPVLLQLFQPAFEIERFNKSCSHMRRTSRGRLEG
jgi:hypothetical protein